MAAAVLVAIIALVNVNAYFDWQRSAEAAAASQPAVELHEYDEWKRLQKQHAAGEFGFTVDVWREMRDGEPQ